MTSLSSSKRASLRALCVLSSYVTIKDIKDILPCPRAPWPHQDHHHDHYYQGYKDIIIIMNQLHVHQVVHVPCVWVQEVLKASAMGFKLHKGHHQSCCHHQACSHHEPCIGSKDHQTTYFVGSKNFSKGKVTIYHHGININTRFHHLFIE